MVKAWKEVVTIPTYEIGNPEKNPIFLENRVYQGSSGKVYPYPVIESVANEPVDHEWQAVWLENEYIKVMILPELGGRIQMAYDKVKERHFVYYNHVIKPALVGLAGPWISGGIEFNWPQHHRPSTYSPVDCSIEENADGSVTVWVNEMEKMFHQKGMAGFTLHPGCAYLEIKGRAINRTPIPQTFLWWANPAVKVNDYYQSVFPQDINAVFDHGKRAVSSFPIATGTYYKMDYSAGVDISNYKNIKVPTSYMGVNSRFNFEGGYENDTKGGMLHVASHHVSPGKKQWTWGNGDFGRAWDRALTDHDGPYIELMAGVFTENQPDFTWLQPYEEKLFTQYFMPYRELGIVKQASKDLIMNITPLPSSPLGEGLACLQLLSTSKHEWHIVVRNDNGAIYYDKIKTLSPEEVFEQNIDTKGTPLDKITVEVCPTSPQGGIRGGLWHAESDDIKPIPDSAEAALRPEEIKTCEQLYLTGLHLEQYRHATFQPTDYYEEALRRDPMDVLNNNALGLWLIRNGQPEKAIPYLRRAVKVLQKRNPNPYNGEPIYNLALALKDSSLITYHLSLISEAYEHFHKATWNEAWASAAFFKAAEISTMEHRYYDALEEVENSLIHNAHHHKARALKACLLRIVGQKEDALAWIAESLRIDPFNYGCLFERGMLMGEPKDPFADILFAVRHENYEELMLDFIDAGRWQEAVSVADMAERQGIHYPMLYYYKAWSLHHLGQEYGDTLRQAEEAPSYCCFPNALQAIPVLQFATNSSLITYHSSLPHAPYYLGCLYYDKRQYEDAVRYWNISLERDDKQPAVYRCLALALYNKLHDEKRALQYMEKAFSLDETDARIFMELDQLYKRLQHPHEERLARLEAHPDVVAQRDDLVLEHATLLNLCGRYEEAIDILAHRQFHVWEGGEGKVSGQYQIARVELAKKYLRPETLNLSKAIELLTECLDFPHNLGEGKLYGAQDNDFYYLMGIAYEKMGNKDKARACWQKGTEGPTEPAPALYYNDAKPDKIFYAALCWQKLGALDKANGLFYKLINFGKNHLFDEVKMDYFAVSLPDLLVWDGDLQLQNEIHCKYMLALGYIGLGNEARGQAFIADVEALDYNHQGIRSLKNLRPL